MGWISAALVRSERVRTVVPIALGVLCQSDPSWARCNPSSCESFQLLQDSQGRGEGWDGAPKSLISHALTCREAVTDHRIS